MGRKKLTEAELENTQTSLTIENAAEAEAEEAQLLSEPEEEEKEEKKPRRSRAKKEEAPEVEAKEESEDSEAVAAVAEEAEEKAEAPKRQRKPRARKPKVEMPEVAAVAAVTAPQDQPVMSMPMPLPTPAAPSTDLTEVLKQWAQIREMSHAVSQELEQVKAAKGLAASMANPNPFDTQDLIRPQNPSTLFVTKFAVAASVVATILSLVSLSLSQSARQAALGAMDTNRVSSYGLAMNPAPTTVLEPRKVIRQAESNPNKSPFEVNFRKTPTLGQKKNRK